MKDVRLLLLLFPAFIRALVCPDGGLCDGDLTCCLKSDKEYGCCPYQNGVCCDDHEHCCSDGTICQQGQCLPYSSNGTQDVVCPGGKYKCPQDNTCCPAGTSFTCCPFAESSCCKDGIHCCPTGTTCDMEQGACKISTVYLRLDVVVCPGGEFQCPDGNTCCILASGDYGCCPLPNAVCCDDEVHCCPSGFSCKDGGCSSDSTIILAPTNFRVDEIKSVVCPDGSSECPNGNTCCLLSSGHYGCCPMSNATCCPDRIHCCPSGTQCDPSKGGCTSLDVVVPFKEIAKEVGIIKDAPVICPDQRSHCPSGNTCCVLPTRRYGCCPLPNATCCSDQEHCCPEGTQCNLSAGGCTQGIHCLKGPQILLPWSRKIPAVFRELNEI